MSAFVGMFDPKLIFCENIFTTKLTSLPVDSFLILASISANVFITIIQLQSYTAFLALREGMRILTLFKKMMCELSDVNISIAFLTKYENLAVIDIMVPLIFKRLCTVRAFALLLIGVFIIYLNLLVVVWRLQLAWVCRLLEDRLFAVRKVNVSVLVTAAVWLGLLHFWSFFLWLKQKHRFFRGIHARINVEVAWIVILVGSCSPSVLWPVELLLKLRVIKTELRLFVLHFGVVNASIQHV